MLSMPKRSSKSSLFHFQVVQLAQILAHIIFSPTLFGILLRFYSEEDLHLHNNSEISILILASSNGPRNDYIFSIQVIYSIFPNLQPKGHKTFPDQIWTSIQALLPRHFDPISLLQPLIISQKVYNNIAKLQALYRSFHQRIQEIWGQSTFQNFNSFGSALVINIYLNMTYAFHLVGPKAATSSAKTLACYLQGDFW